MSNMIQADPAKLRKIAEDIAKAHKALNTALSSSNSQVASLGNAWTGDAATAFHASFKKVHTSCTESLETVKRLSTALYESAEAYEKNEKAVQQEASKMPKLPKTSFR